MALDDLEALELERFPALPLLRRAFELRANVTAYDAAYVALAEVLPRTRRRWSAKSGPVCILDEASQILHALRR